MSRNSQKEVIAQRIKQVRKLEAELDRIRTAKFNLGYVELPKPIRDGWYKTLRVRNDILRSKQGPIVQEVLDVVVEEIWGREKKYADKSWRKYFNRNRDRYSRAGIKRLDEKEFGQLSPKLKKYFFKRQVSRTYIPAYACTIPNHYYVDTYRRAYIYKFKIVSSELESRDQEVRQLLANPVLRPYSIYSHDHYRYYDYSSKKARRKVKMELLKSFRKNRAQLYTSVSNQI